MEADSIEYIERILKENDIASYYIKQLQIRQTVFPSLLQSVERDSTMYFKHTINDDFTIDVLASEQDIRELFLKYPNIDLSKTSNRIDISKIMNILDEAIASLTAHQINLPDQSLHDQKLFILSLNTEQIEQKCQVIAKKALSQVQQQLSTSSQGMPSMEFYQVWRKYFPMRIDKSVDQWQYLVQACREPKIKYTFSNGILTLNFTKQFAINRKCIQYMKGEIWIPQQLVDLLHQNMCLGSVVELMYEGQNVLNDSVVQNILGRLQQKNYETEQNSQSSKLDIYNKDNLGIGGASQYQNRSEIQMGAQGYDQQQIMGGNNYQFQRAQVINLDAQNLIQNQQRNQGNDGHSRQYSNFEVGQQVQVTIELNRTQYEQRTRFQEEQAYRQQPQNQSGYPQTRSQTNQEQAGIIRQQQQQQPPQQPPVYTQSVYTNYQNQLRSQNPNQK